MLNANDFEVDPRPQYSNKSEDQNDCPVILNEIWTRQLLKRQEASDKAYAKKHSLEIAFAPKVLSTKIVDRSNFVGRVA